MEDDRAAGVPWRRIAIEFLIIVAGDMVALATDCWTSSLDNRKKARSHLEQLRADFRDNEQIAKGAAGYKNSLAGSASAVLGAITAQPSEDHCAARS